MKGRGKVKIDVGSPLLGFPREKEDVACREGGGGGGKGHGQGKTTKVRWGGGTMTPGVKVAAVAEELSLKSGAHCLN